MSQIAMPTTGDPEEDRRRMDLMERHTRAIDAGLCPNGHGRLVLESRWDARCPTCNFHYSQNTPIEFPGIS